MCWTYLLKGSLPKYVPPKLEGSRSRISSLRKWNYFSWWIWFMDYHTTYHSLLESLEMRAFCSASILFRLYSSTVYLSSSAFFSFSILFRSIIFFFLFSDSLSHLFLSPRALNFSFSMLIENSSRHSVREFMFSSREMTWVKYWLYFRDKLHGKTFKLIGLPVFFSLQNPDVIFLIEGDWKMFCHFLSIYLNFTIILIL